MFSRMKNVIYLFSLYLLNIGGRSHITDNKVNDKPNIKQHSKVTSSYKKINFDTASLNLLLEKTQNISINTNKLNSFEKNQYEK
jgi:hypothetical protein